MPGDPGSLERLVQHKNTVMRAEGREKVRTHLEQSCASLLERMSDVELDYLIELITSLCWQTARAYHAHAIECVTAAMHYVPAYNCIPDPRDKGDQAQRPGASEKDDPTVSDTE